MNWKAILAGAVSGLVAAVGVDYHAWQQHPGPFDWGLAVPRWFFGAFGGAVTAAGFGAAFGGT